MLIYRTNHGLFLNTQERWHSLPGIDFDSLFNHADLNTFLTQASQTNSIDPASIGDVLAPIGNQEVWAAGVTYFRSRTARMEESKDAGGGTFYDRVYDAERPEIFFKATPQRVVNPAAAMHLRSDSKWIVPEPELTLAINNRGEIIGYTVGNDLSCRDIEGENPLYLPQAKCFARCAAIGPAIFISQQPLPAETEVLCRITRNSEEVFRGSTTLSQLKRRPQELADFLYRDNTFPTGAFLMTGTGIVPPDDFCLQADDDVHITIEPIGTLSNTFAA